MTGAARGTGESTARLFVEEGARVLLGDVLDDLGTNVARDLGSDAVFQHLDVTSEREWRDAVDAAQQRFGDVDVYVANYNAIAEIMLNDGTGTVTDTGQRLGELSSAMKLGDLNGDGHL